jgi:hypothetical protein
MKDENEVVADKRIGNHNPSDHPAVAEIKSRAKSLIVTILELCPPGRRRSKALTDIEGAAMFAVKSLFAPED